MAALGFRMRQFRVVVDGAGPSAESGVGRNRSRDPILREANGLGERRTAGQHCGNRGRIRTPGPMRVNCVHPWTRELVEAAVTIEDVERGFPSEMAALYQYVPRAHPGKNTGRLPHGGRVNHNQRRQSGRFRQVGRQQKSTREQQAHQGLTGIILEKGRSVLADKHRIYHQGKQECAGRARHRFDDFPVAERSSLGGARRNILDDRGNLRKHQFRRQTMHAQNFPRVLNRGQRDDRFPVDAKLVKNLKVSL